MLLNLTNHPSALWPAEQTADAETRFGGVIDMSFPPIPPDASEAVIESLAKEYLDRILNMDDIPVVHIMGEFNFCYALITKLKANGVRCVASTTERVVTEENGLKISQFKFVRFREYVG